MSAVLVGSGAMSVPVDVGVALELSLGSLPSGPHAAHNAKLLTKTADRDSIRALLDPPPAGADCGNDFSTSFASNQSPICVSIPFRWDLNHRGHREHKVFWLGNNRRDGSVPRPIGVNPKTSETSVSSVVHPLNRGAT